MSERSSIAIATGTILAATLFLFWPLWLDAPRYFEWDVPEQYWPDLVYLCESMHEGQLPRWNPYDRGGYPYYADPQSAAYHPSSWLICGLAGPRPSLAWATLRVPFGFALAGLFGLLWLRRLRAPWSGAIAGAIVIEAAPFMRHNWELNLTHALAYLPLMLWAAERLATERKAADGIVLALAIALCGWVGSPPALFLSITCTAAYLTFRLGEEARLGSIKRAIVPLAICAVLTVGLLAIVIVPLLELASHSVQAGRDFRSIADGALDSPLALFLPQPGNHLYVGWLAITLGVVALFARVRVPYFLWALAIVAVLLAMGGPVFRLAFDLVPGVAWFRLPHRYEAWLGPAFGALTALGLGAISDRPVPRWSPIPFVITGAALYFTAVGPALLALGIAAILFARSIGHVRSPLLGLALGVLILIDVSQELPPERHTRSGTTPCAGDLDYPIEHRVFDEFEVGCRAGTRHRRRDLRGYQDPLTLASHERVLAALHDHPELAAQFNVRYALQAPHFIHGWDRHFLATEERRRVVELPAMPIAYFVPADRIERARDRSAALRRTIELAPSPIAIVEGLGGGTAGPTELVAATDVVLRPDTLTFVIDAPDDGAVVINEAHYPGWSARVDGRVVPIHRANGFVRSIPIRRGRHRVSMVFDPPAARWGRVALAVSIVGALAGLALLRVRPVRVRR
jgi:hypothetical protein